MANSEEIMTRHVAYMPLCRREQHLDYLVLISKIHVNLSRMKYYLCYVVACFAFEEFPRVLNSYIIAAIDLSSLFVMAFV